ncbi:MAG: hypothetical protein GF421_02535 [Candidatus Aminicenantes bacterium]|nr:hypothetical protein [Candidatus Aminicenantes bacterium]
MQDRYTGDIGDFGKYGLLRYILDREDMTLGVNWYLVPNEAHNDDGKYNRYTVREFIFVLHENHSKVKNTLINSFLKSEWGKGEKPHFTFSEQF